MTQLNQPHDALAKKFLTNLSIAREFLKIHLDNSIQSICDISSLCVEPCSYIEDDLKSHSSDVLYKLNLKECNTKCLYVYTLVEHQSRAEVLMPLRIIKYQLAIIQNHLDKYGKDVNILPLVVPIVFYNGRQSPYPYGSNIEQLFANKELYKKAQLGKFELVDLTTMEMSEILKHHGKVAILEMFEKIAFVRDFKLFIDNIIEVLTIAKSDKLSESLTSSALMYILGLRETNETKPLIEKIKQKIPNYGETIMNVFEEIEQKGMQKGIQKGIQKGMQKGRQELQRQMIQDMLSSGIEPSLVAKISHLTEKEVIKIKESIQ